MIISNLLEKHIMAVKVVGICQKEITANFGEESHLFTITAKVYVVREPGPQIYHAPAPFESLYDGDVIELGEWCEYRLSAEIWDGDEWLNFGKVWDSKQCDNGVESQRSDRVGAMGYALNTLNELESGIAEMTMFKEEGGEDDDGSDEDNDPPISKRMMAENSPPGKVPTASGKGLRAATIADNLLFWRNLCKEYGGKVWDEDGHSGFAGNGYSVVLFPDHSIFHITTQQGGYVTALNWNTGYVERGLDMPDLTNFVDM
jgi:hypothetical protein